MQDAAEISQTLSARRIEEFYQGSNPSRFDAEARPVRIAFLTPTLLMGGAERWMLSMARRCDRRRIQWSGIVLTEGGVSNPEMYREMLAYMPMYAGPATTGNSSDHPEIIRCPSTTAAIAQVTEGADVLIVWGLAKLDRLLQKLEIPVVFVSHGACLWTAQAIETCQSVCTHFVAVSEAALKPFPKEARTKAVVLHNGIDVERCSPTGSRDATRAALGFGPDDILIGYVGRFSAEKNPLAAAVAARHLGGRYRAVYCGEGWYENDLRARAFKIAGDRVRFIEFQRRVGNILAALDVFILASPSEGFSLALTEAWYSGVPTVATRVGSIPELERKYGQLVSAVPINPTRLQLGDAVVAAVSAPFRHEVVPRAQRMVAEHFTANAMAHRWMDYLEFICHRRESYNSQTHDVSAREVVYRTSEPGCSRLPRSVEIPPRTIVETEPYVQLCWDYLHATLVSLKIDVKINPDLPCVCPSAFEMHVDGVTAVYDYSDYLLVAGEQQRYRHWFRFHHTSGFTPHDNLASFPPISFLNWDEYRHLGNQIRYDASGETILHAQAFEFLSRSESARDRDLYRRRKRARERLISEFGHRVDTEIRPQRDFWRAAGRALVSVHIPGSWPHSLDRGQHQLLGFGVCTISPTIWTSTLGETIQPYEHYVPIRDDDSDLVEKVQWCEQHREECAAIGRRARAFFLKHSTPSAIWTSIVNRMHPISAVDTQSTAKTLIEQPRGRESPALSKPP